VHEPKVGRFGAAPTIEDGRNETLRRIGRNVVLFQELENILKFLASAQHPSMPMSKARATRERAESIRIKTLGQVAGQVVEELFTACDAESSTPAEITEPWLSFSFRIASDSADLEESRRTLKALIDERNHLVHHLLSRWNLREAESCNALSAELDEQRRRIIVEIEKYRAYANTIREAARELQAFIDSNDGKRHFDAMYLQSSQLTMLLAQIATTHSREDGWTLLSVAGAQLSSLIPEQFAKLKREHGEGSLHRLVAAIGLFDVQSETTPNGGTRAVYRTRPCFR
jgi:hypothetical protein